MLKSTPSSDSTPDNKGLGKERKINLFVMKKDQLIIDKSVHHIISYFYYTNYSSQPLRTNRNTIFWDLKELQELVTRDDQAFQLDARAIKIEKIFIVKLEYKPLMPIQICRISEGKTRIREKITHHSYENICCCSSRAECANIFRHSFLAHSKRGRFSVSTSDDRNTSSLFTHSLQC